VHYHIGISRVTYISINKFSFENALKFSNTRLWHTIKSSVPTSGPWTTG